MSRSRLSNFLNDVKTEYEKARFVYKDKEMKKRRQEYIEEEVENNRDRPCYFF